MNAAMTHPDSELLQAYGLGMLDAVESTEIERHVGACDTCCHTLELLADDSLVAILRPSAGLPGNPSTVAAEGFHVPAELKAHPRYRVIELLGSGGMGAVYKAEHLVMERLVALKVIRRSLLDRPDTVERFAREVRAAARLAHPHIVRAYDAENAGKIHFLVMEFVAGASLARVVGDQGPLPVARACEYIRQAALGLQHAFEHGTVHRDIKPQNLILTFEGQIKILDFGLARFVSESESAAPREPGTAFVVDHAARSGTLTGGGVVMGSADYIAPEQIADAHAADIRADIYSLGCTLYHLLAGHPPFPQHQIADKLNGHREQPPRPLNQIRKDVQRDLTRVVERMMAKSPGQRYRTPAEVAEALAPFTGAVGASRRRRRWAIVAAALLVMLGLTTYLFGPMIVRFVSNEGELVLESDDPDIQVIVLKHGERVRTIDLKGEQRIDLPAGEYQFKLVSGRRDLELNSKGLILRRGGTEFVAVRAVPGFVGEVRRMDGHEGWVYHVAFSADGQRALSGGFDKTIRLWDLNKGVELQRMKGHTGLVWSVAISPDGRYALSGSGGEFKDEKWSGGNDNSARLWDLANGTEVRSFNGHLDWVFFVGFLPNGRVLTASGDKTLRLWDMDSGDELECMCGHTGQVKSVAVSADGRYALSGGDRDDGTLRLWDLETGKQLHCMPGHNSHIVSVAFSPDGRHALSGSWDSTLRLWDLATGKERSFFQHERHVLSVAYTPDGRRALWCGPDCYLRVWDIERWTESHCFQRQSNIVNVVAISPDGRRALTGGADQTLRLWALPPAD